MAIDLLKTLDIIEAMENFIARKRPPIFEIKPRWNNPEIKIESNIAKATFVKAKNNWKVFWQRADLKWHTYKPEATVKSITRFLTIVEEDDHHCFWR